MLKNQPEFRTQVDPLSQQDSKTGFCHLKLVAPEEATVLHESWLLSKPKADWHNWCQDIPGDSLTVADMSQVCG